MPDDFSDVLTLAGKASRPSYGSPVGSASYGDYAASALGMLHKVTSSHWSYPGCVETIGSNRLPVELISDARVQAAITAGIMVPYEINDAGKAVKVVPATSIWAMRSPLAPGDVGTARSAPPVATLASIETIGTFRGVWLQAWLQGLVAEKHGGNLPPGLFVLRLFDTLSSAPAAGTRVGLDGGGVAKVAAATQYGTGHTNGSSASALFDLALARN